MSTATATKTVLKGGEWLIKESSAIDTFTANDFSEEQLMIKDMCNQFLDAEIYPILDRIDDLEPGLMKSLVAKAGEQGLLASSFPEEYGGLGKDFVTSTIVNEYLGAGHSFSVAIAAHTGIGTLPILYFGTPEQKQKWRDTNRGTQAEGQGVNQQAPKIPATYPQKKRGSLRKRPSFRNQDRLDPSAFAPWKRHYLWRHLQRQHHTRLAGEH